ncbi:MAG: hypothetical protein SPF40_05490 [Prevotella sp.]|nr:hypothetical protein [Prevotella sp.]
MMENNLYKTIEDIKNALSDVSSARQQVSDTVASYSKTQEYIQDYVNNLNTIEDSLNQLVSLLQSNKTVINQQSSVAIENLKSTCNEVVENTKSELSDVSRNFSKKLNSDIKVMSKHIELFNDTIKKTDTLTSNVEKTSDEVSKLVLSIKALQQEIFTSQKEQDDVLAHIHGNIISIKELNNTILGKIGDNQKIILNSFTTMTNKIETTKEEINKKINTNRNLAFVIIVFLSILAMIQYYAS